MPSKWALSAVIYYIKIDNKTQIQRPNFRNARNMCVDGLNHLAGHGLCSGLVCLGFGFGFGYGCGFGFGFDTRLGSGSIAPKSCLWGSVFFWFGSLCVCVESPLTLRFFIVLLSCRCCLLLNLNFEWCARKTDGYFLKMRMYSRKANEIILIINYYAILCDLFLM